MENLPNDLLFQIDFPSNIEYIFEIINRASVHELCSIVFDETSWERLVWTESSEISQIYNGNCIRFMQHNVQHFQFDNTDRVVYCFNISILSLSEYYAILEIFFLFPLSEK